MNLGEEGTNIQSIKKFHPAKKYVCHRAEDESLEDSESDHTRKAVSSPVVWDMPIHSLTGAL